ncbi:molybdopterin-binding protein [Natronolimnohabitans sp. A-GB9]|uniref:MogA/MoaB family molybdenum cofactor biosynthesis protein n=1 Tax=Natronolimnohabitans sp. A-GB9 TaxID=3069757 RepID=UPI0027AF0E3C|nr:molybdopterin-binding protein [Natronolimnohabitans sp. A-GB9]MDQ2049954.1 molybdopterin-binding protein [Natronolimnohabitans sp. A-GB9]
MTASDSSGDETSQGSTDGWSEAKPETNEDHDEQPAEEERSLGIGVVTIATSRSLATDAAGEAVVTALKAAGHEIATREHIGNDHDRVQSIVSRTIDRDDVDLVVTAGATSIEPSDVAIEAVEPLLDKKLSAFGELFTKLAYDAVGTRAVASRTAAGVTDGVPVFSLPGNEDAARLALEEIILPEADHLVALARETPDEDKWAAAESSESDEDAEDETAANGGE